MRSDKMSVSVKNRVHFGRILAFLSYDSHDIDGVSRFSDRLRAQGVDIWRDQTQLRPGSDWRHAIERALGECDVVFACVSIRSGKNMGFLQTELALALAEAGKRPPDPPYVIPVRLEKCDMPTMLKHLHAYDVFDPAKFPAFLDVLDSFVPKQRTLATVLALASRQLDGLVGLSLQESRLDDVLRELSESKMDVIRALTAAGRSEDAKVLAAIAPHPSYRDKRARATSLVVACRNHILSVLQQVSSS
jgi:hypothetical protein